MMWDYAIDAHVALWKADALLISAAGVGSARAIYPAQTSRPVAIPSIEWMPIPPNREDELFEYARFQVDWFARGWTAARLIERRLRTLSHRDLSRRFTLNGVSVPVWSQLFDARTHEFPSDPGVIHRSLDLDLWTLRSKYAHA